MKYTTQLVTETRCPASGRAARWCNDQTHVACWAALAESIKLDKQVEEMLDD